MTERVEGREGRSYEGMNGVEDSGVATPRACAHAKLTGAQVKKMWKVRSKTSY